MEVIKINPKRIDKRKVNYIVKFLQESKVVILPTDTSYGLAVNALDNKAVKRAYQVKNRARNKPLSIIVKDINQAGKYSIIDKRTIILFDKFLPGRLTIVVKKNHNLSSKVTGGKKRVGLRIPDCKIIQAITDKVNFPITATSANISGEKEPYSVSEVLRQYKGKKYQPDLIIDAGKLVRNKPSTVVYMDNDRIKLIRSGPIKFKDVVNSLKK